MREFNQVAIVDNVSQANAITHLEPTQIDVIFATAILSLHMNLRIFCTNDSKLIEEKMETKISLSSLILEGNTIRIDYYLIVINMVLKSITMIL